jgi:hypothetical protein
MIPKIDQHLLNYLSLQMLLSEREYRLECAEHKLNTLDKQRQQLLADNDDLSNQLHVAQGNVAN